MFVVDYATILRNGRGFFVINDAVLKDLFGVSGRDLQDLRAAVAQAPLLSRN